MWHGIVSNYDEYADKNRTEVGVEKNKEGWIFFKLKDVILLGVPPTLRGRLWLLMMGAKEMMKKNPGIFEVKISQFEKNLLY